jgi:pilus assembly protein Flp/PilA
MLKRFLNDENGQGMVEYGLIIAVVALVVVGGLSLLGGDL